MGTTRVQLNHAGVSALLNSSGVRDHLTGLMGPVLAAAREGAPVDKGDYLAGIELEQATTDRVSVRVVASDGKSMLVESRTGNLARAFGSVG